MEQKDPPLEISLISQVVAVWLAQEAKVFLDTAMVLTLVEMKISFLSGRRKPTELFS